MPSLTKERTGDLINRGSRNPTPGGTALFVGLRALDPFIQYNILAPNGLGFTLLTALGVRARVPGVAPQTGFPLIDTLGLSPPRLALLAMSIGSVVKQIHWRLFISQEEFPVGPAFTVGFFNTLNNSINTVAFCSVALSSTGNSSESSLTAPAIAGSVFYVVGLALEWISEIQRVRFKKDPANKGKPYMGGLWKLARHINYGGYTLWRAGFTMAGAGWGLGTFFGVLFGWDFATRAIPVLDRYCSGRVSCAFCGWRPRTLADRGYSMARIGTDLRSRRRIGCCRLFTENSDQNGPESPVVYVQHLNKIQTFPLAGE